MTTFRRLVGPIEREATIKAVRERSLHGYATTGAAEEDVVLLLDVVGDLEARLNEAVSLKRQALLKLAALRRGESAS